MASCFSDVFGELGGRKAVLQSVGVRTLTGVG